jgi:serine/threonine protein kinase
MATVSTSGGNWLILPKQLPIINLHLSIHSAQPHGKLIRYGYDLIKGLGYLHKHGVAHLDIKPRNLVYTTNGPLQIIDFDAAVRVESEDIEVEGICGTQGWRAPEIGDDEDEVGPSPRFSPILADRWSCGSVLLWLVADTGREGAVLVEMAKQLLDMEPHRRPSLVDWDGLESGGNVGPHVKVRPTSY